MASMCAWRRTVLTSLVIAGLTALVSALGCDSSAARRREMASGNPLDRVRAAVNVSSARDAQGIHKLVDLLEDGDAAVRMYAILSLQRLCGQDYGYRYYESEPLRAAAVERWRGALRAGEVELQPSAQRSNGRGRVAQAGADGEPGPMAGGSAATESEAP